MIQKHSANMDAFNHSWKDGNFSTENRLISDNHYQEMEGNRDMENEVVIWLFIDGFLFSAILCGNILTIYAIMLSKTLLKIISNQFILSLTISDLLVGFMVLYHMMFYIQPQLGQFFGFCIVRLVLVSLACTASAFNILGIAIDRYIAIVYPLHYSRIITHRSAKFISILGWILAFTTATVPIYWNKWNVNKNSFVRCEMGHIVHPLHVVTMYLPIFILVYSAIFVFYLRIIREARKQAKRMSHLNQDRHNPWKSIQILTLVMGSFTVSYLPFIIVLVMNSIFQRKTKTISTIYRVTYSLVVANSAVNPLIYALKNQDLKKTLCNAVHCKSVNSNDDSNYK